MLGMSLSLRSLIVCTSITSSGEYCDTLIVICDHSTRKCSSSSYHYIYLHLSVTSYITALLPDKRCLPLLGHDDVALFE